MNSPLRHIISQTTINMTNNPYEVLALFRQMGQKKYHTPLPKLVLLGILAGVYISMGALIATYLASGIAGWASANPVLPKLISGIVFPMGLMLVVLVGAELFTGNTAYLMPSTIAGDIPRWYFLKNWLIVYFSNLVGAVAFSYFLAYKTQVFASDYAHQYLLHLAEYKVGHSFSETFYRGIGANWLVCLATWLAFSSKTMAGKCLGLWFPVMAFVTLGFEHSIANLFYIPTAMFYGANIEWTKFIINNLIPSTLGNILGGACFVGMVYTYLYGAKAVEK